MLKKNAERVDADIFGSMTFSSDEMKTASMLCASHSLADIAPLLNASNEVINDIVKSILRKTGFNDVESFVQYLVSTGNSKKLMSTYVEVMCKHEFLTTLEFMRSISKPIHVNLYYCAADNGLVQSIHGYLQYAGIDTCVNVGVAGSNTIKALLRCNQDYLYDRNKFDCIFDIDKESTYTVVLKIIGNVIEHEHVVKALRKIKTVERHYQRNVRCKGLLYIYGVIMKNKTIKYTTAISTVLLCTIAVSPQNGMPKEVRQISHSAAALQESVILHRIGMNAKINDAWHDNEVSCVVLVGPGGAGKTTLSRGMIESKKYDVAYELNAESDIVLMESLSRLAVELAEANGRSADLKLAMQGSPEEKKRKTIEFIKTNLKDRKNWLLVYDNVDEAKVLDGVFPTDDTWGNGHILITTRNQNITSDDFSIQTRILDVELLSDDEKYALFTKICDDTKYRKEDVLNLLSAVPGYPLDVSTVACELKDGNYTLDEYKAKLDAINSLDEVDESLMTDSSAYGKTRYGINVATLNRILEEHRDDSDVEAALLMMAMCYSQKFPLKAFTLFRDEGLKNKIISSLKKYSFISEDANSISMHRSVQEIWFNILKNKMHVEDIEKALQVFVDQVIEYKEITHFFRRMNIIRDRVYHCAMQSSLVRALTLLQKLNINKDLKTAVTAKLLMAHMHVQNNLKLGYKTISESFNTIMALDEKYKVLSDWEKGVVLTVGGGNERINDNAKATRMVQQAVNIADSIEDAAPLQIVSRVYLSDILFSSGKFKESSIVLNEASSIIHDEMKKYANEFWIDQLYVQVEYFKAAQSSEEYFTNKHIAEDSALRLKHMLRILNGENVRKNPIKGGTPGLLPIVQSHLVCVCNMAEMYNEAEDIFEDAKHLYENYKGIAAGVFMNSYAHYCNTLLRLGKVKKAFKYSKNSINNVLSADGATQILALSVACYSEAAVRIGAPDEAVSSCSDLLKMKPFIGLENAKSHEVGGKKLRMIEYFARCMFNAGVACRKLEKNDEANTYFEKSIKSLRILAEKVYSDEKINEMAIEGGFNVSTDVNENLAKGKKLFKMIYGEDHSLNTNYIDKV